MSTETLKPAIYFLIEILHQKFQISVYQNYLQITYLMLVLVLRAHCKWNLYFLPIISLGNGNFIVDVVYCDLYIIKVVYITQ